jgi:hypothetical protein
VDPTGENCSNSATSASVGSLPEEAESLSVLGSLLHQKSNTRAWRINGVCRRAMSCAMDLGLVRSSANKAHLSDRNHI